VCAPGRSEPVDVATYTTIHFSNAPEAIERVVSWKQTKDGILVVSRANPCGARPGGLVRTLVKKAGPSTFHAGDWIMSGTANPDTTAFWAVRRVDPSEIPPQLHCFEDR